jgi:hypothetical protein
VLQVKRHFLSFHGILPSLLFSDIARLPFEPTLTLAAGGIGVL